MPAGKSVLNPIPNTPWMDISVDLIMGLLEAQGYNTILVVCDRTDREDESRVGAIFENVHGLPPDELAGVAGNCQILI